MKTIDKWDVRQIHLCLWGECCEWKELYAMIEGGEELYARRGKGEKNFTQEYADFWETNRGTILCERWGIFRERKGMSFSEGGGGFSLFHNLGCLQVTETLRRWRLRASSWVLCARSAACCASPCPSPSSWPTSTGVVSCRRLIGIAIDFHNHGEGPY